MSIVSVLGVLQTQEYTRVHENAAKTLDNLLTPASWAVFPSLVGDGKSDMECAVRCSQDTKCQSFIMSGGSCYVGGETVPKTEDFVDSSTITTSFYTQVQS